MLSLAFDMDIMPADYGGPLSVLDGHPDMSLRVLDNDRPDRLSYFVTWTVLAENDDGLIDLLVAHFKHLPGFRVVSTEKHVIEESTMAVGPTEKWYTVRCLFKSDVDFVTLKRQFRDQVATGNLVSNGTRFGEYVAFVTIGSADSDPDGLIGIVHALLYRVCAAEGGESDLNFDPIKTDVLV